MVHLALKDLRDAETPQSTDMVVAMTFYSEEAKFALCR